MERRHEVTRLEGFSDAVFGFALTLLVVSLEVPDSTEALRAMMFGFLPFALMFAMICWIWYEHQQFFRRYGLQDAGTVTINSFLLFVVLFYVYPLKFLTTRLVKPLFEGGSVGIPDGDLVMLLYSSGVVMIFGAFIALHYQAWRNRLALALNAEELIQLKSSMLGHAMSAALGLASIGIVLVARATGHLQLTIAAGMIYFLMGPLHGWNGYATGRAVAALRKQTSTYEKR
ncbi:MAG: DUF1211 domain-containing protein [Acidobacteria bacterium]|nr:DUF1211 domain-containing protein [Acidobacteriota bacterium]